MLATQELVATMPGGHVSAVLLGPHGGLGAEVQLPGGGPAFSAQPNAWLQVQAWDEPGAHSNVNPANSESDARLQLRC